MSEPDPLPNPLDGLRRRAEEALAKQRLADQDAAQLSPAEARELVHELQVHQVELEMQNEELRRAREELAASRDRYADLYDFAPVGYLTVDGQGTILEANLTASQLLGSDHARLLGGPLGRCVAVADRDALHLHLTEALRSGEPRQCELELAGGDGAPRSVRLDTVRAAGVRGAAPQCRMAMSDVTERARATEALRRGERRAQTRLTEIEAVYDAAHVGLCVLDRQLRYVRVNRLFAEMDGCPPEAHIGRTVREVVPDLAPRAEQIAEQVIRTGEPALDVEFGGTTPARPGEERQWVEQWLPLKGPDGEVVALNVVAEEVTDHREIQERLARTERLAALGRLGGEVAHELRNPLGAIKNAVYFLHMALEDPSPEVQETLSILDREVGTCERIVRELLDFARSRPPAHQQMELNRILEQALARTRVPPEVETSLDMAEDLPAIQADPLQLAQVAGNILHNAVQAMPEGGRLIVRSRPEGSGWVSFAVTDTGVGIPAAELGKLFEPLYTTKATGIGLGLAVTKSLVEGHGGTIEVQSREGQGSTFTVRLPVGRQGGPDHGGEA